MCIRCSIMLLYFTLDFWSFIPDRAVPATNIVVCYKVHPYCCTVFLFFAREICEHMCKSGNAVTIKCNAHV